MSAPRSDADARPWLARYPKGVPADVDLDRYASIADVFAETTRRFSAKPAFSSMGVTLSFREVDELAEAFAAFCRHDLGLQKGDRIALQMPNVLQYPVAMFGAFKAGLTVVNVNPLYTEREMKHQLEDAGCKAIVILANFARHLQSVLPETEIGRRDGGVVVTELGDLFPFPKKQIVNAVVRYGKRLVPSYSLPQAIGFGDAIARGRKRVTAGEAGQGVACAPEDIAFLQYTGGTTGVSKGAMLTHRNLVANMLQIQSWIRPLLVDGEEVAIAALPLYHVFALTVNALALFSVGAKNVLIANPRDVPDLVKTMRDCKWTTMTGVNTLFNALLNNSDFGKMDFSQVKMSVAGGMALQRAVTERWKKTTGTPVVEGYGLTETSPLVSCNPVDGTDRVGTIGLPAPSTEVKFIGDEGEDVPFGSPGEICVRGPQVMKGYWRRPDETAKVMLPGGWLRTGDVGVIDADGFLKIVDRKKDMIIVSGFNVYPNEVEDAIASCSGVLEVAAVGVPDDRSGETVKAFVVKRDPSLTAEAVIAHARKSLTGYKVPRHVEFRDELPKTNVGKILRRALREAKPQGD